MFELIQTETGRRQAKNGGAAKDYTVGGGQNRAERRELIIYSWDREAEPAGLFWVLSSPAAKSGTSRDRLPLSSRPLTVSVVF